MLFQCDLATHMKHFNGEYLCSLNSPDLYDVELPLKSSRCFGGTMVLWKREYDPFITIHPVASSSLLPIIFSPPWSSLTVHIAIYLPTAGRDTDFVEALAEVQACIIELHNIYPEAPFFLRGDFNSNLNNQARMGLLDLLCSDHDLISVDIPHPTYHHFLGNGSSDSTLDKILFSKSVPVPEQLITIHCKLSNPLIESHHDLLVSNLVLPYVTANERAYGCNPPAPRVTNKRSKIKWTEAGVEAYKEAVKPLLHLVQQVLLTPSTTSRSLVSLCLQSTNRILVETAIATNKSVDLGKNMKPKSRPVSPAIKKSQKQLLKNHKIISMFTGYPSELYNLKQKHANDRDAHRKLVRSQNAAESIERDRDLFDILDNNPNKVYKMIKANKACSTRPISQLTVGDRLYAGKAVPDGFFASLLDLKTFKPENIQDSGIFSRYEADYENIIELCSSGKKIPRITLQKSTKILKSVRPQVSDYYSITASHFLHAGEIGIIHFYLLLQALISDINNITVDEVNTVHATILFKGHSKNKTLASSYRTISSCPLIAKSLDIYLRDLNIESWNQHQAPTQFLGQGSSHELAALLLTELIQYSLNVHHQPLFILYLDAKSAFDNVLRQLLIRNLYFAGTEGEELLAINNRLAGRKTFAEWDKQIMGPIHDELGVEQGGVNSGDFYKIYAKNQLQMAQSSRLGVKLSKDLIISAIGQADDTVLVSNNLHSLQNLLQLSLFYCSKFNVQLCPSKTKLQVISTKRMTAAVSYLKEYSPVKLNGVSLKFFDTAEHVGIVRSVSGNLPNIMSRLTAHKKAVSAVLHTGSARHHRGNPAASLRLQQVYGLPVLLSGLGSLVLNKAEKQTLSKHHQKTIQGLLRLYPNTPRAVYYFLAGCLPCEALIHLQQLSLLAMITTLVGSPLHAHASTVFTTNTTSNSWFYQVRDICLQYNLPHPLTLLTPPCPFSKAGFKRLAKKHIIRYWEEKLRCEASILPSLRFFKPNYMSIVTPHPLLLTAGSSPYEVTKANIQAMFLSGRYRTEKLCRYWSSNSSGHCLLPHCVALKQIEDEDHILLLCQSLANTRLRLSEFTMAYAKAHPVVCEILLTFTNPNCPQYLQFLIDCSVIPQVIALSQKHGQIILQHLFKVTRTWCYSLHRDRLKLLGRWRSF